MENQRLYLQNKTLKGIVTVYLTLCSLGFAVAALISHDRYKFNLETTKIFYLGSDTQLAYPKLYGQLIQTAHVHSFTLPLVFLTVWLPLSLVPIRHFYKMIMIFGGALAIVAYNAAPFMVRYVSPDWLFLFPLGGISLFFFFFSPALLVLVETWWGPKWNLEA